MRSPSTGQLPVQGLLLKLVTDQQFPAAAWSWGWMPALYAAWSQTRRFQRPSSPGFPAAAGARNRVRAKQLDEAPATKKTLLKLHGRGGGAARAA